MTVNPDAVLDARIRSYWRDSPGDLELGTQIAGEAATDLPATLVVTARSAAIARANWDQVPASWQARLTSLFEHEEILRRFHRIVDLLGDPNSDATAVLGVLTTLTAAGALATADLDAIRKIHPGSSTRAETTLQVLDALGDAALPADLQAGLRDAALEQMGRGTEFQAQALFVGTGGHGFALGVSVWADTHLGEVHAHTSADPVLRQQATDALNAVLEGRSAKWELEWPVLVEGDSIGLSMCVAGLVATGRLSADPLLAATGRIDMSGRIRGVVGIEAKLAAAREVGIRRVLMSVENQAEVPEAAQTEFDIVYLERVDALRGAVARGFTSTASGYDGRKRTVPVVAGHYGLEVEDECELSNGHRFSVTDGATRANINIYTGPKGTVNTDGTAGTARDAAQQLVDDWLRPPSDEPRPLESFVIPPARQQRLAELADAQAIRETSKEQERCRWLFDERATQARLILYNSGKCVLHAGTAPAWDRARDVILRALDGLGASSVPSPSVEPSSSAVLPSGPHIGTDEAGKGDFFGPLVCGAVFTDESLEAEFRRLGVKDSKRLSDKRVRELAIEIKAIAKKRWKITRIPPRRFNELYEEMRTEGKNLNTLLAWGHTRSLEDLLNNGCDPEFVIVDKFADARYIMDKLLHDARRRKLEIIQVPKAESDLAVAAASILARADFLEWIETTSRELGVDLPKGASDRVIEVGRAVVAKFGESRLHHLAKMSFKTAEKVLSP